MNRKVDLLSIGDVSIDQYMLVSKALVKEQDKHSEPLICFEYGSKIPVDSFSSNIAGNACNNVIAMNKLGFKCAIYTELGDDPNGNKFIDTFNKVGIDSTFCIQNPKTSTNVHSIIIYQAERTIFSYHADREYQVREWPTPTWIYYTSMPPRFDKFQTELVEYVKATNTPLAFNPGTYHLKAGLESIKNILAVTSVLFVNETEAKLLVGDDNLESLHKKLQKLGPSVTVITQGKEGSSAYDGKEFAKLGILQEAFEIIDKTGAGDAHSAGFLAGMMCNKNLLDCLKWGTINSGYVIRKVGSVHGLLTKAEIENILQTGIKFTH